MKIKIKRLTESAVIPSKGSYYAAGYDLSADCLSDGCVIIDSHKSTKIRTGVSIEIPEGYFGAIFARSGLATKNGLRPANCVGVCDCDYRGEYIVSLHNDTKSPQVINHGDRIAQLVILPYQNIEFEEVVELGDTCRGEDGFGSTGRN